MDSLIRVQVKDILYLPACTPNGLIYCCKRDGGLGIPKLETLATSTDLKQRIQLHTGDRTLQALLGATHFKKRLERMAKSIRLQWPALTFKQMYAHKRCLKASELRQWSQFPSKGKGALSFVDGRFGNCWLYDPSLLKLSRFLTALLGQVNRGSAQARGTT